MYLQWGCSSLCHLFWGHKLEKPHVGLCSLMQGIGSSGRGFSQSHNPTGLGPHPFSQIWNAFPHFKKMLLTVADSYVASSWPGARSNWHWSSTSTPLSLDAANIFYDMFVTPSNDGYVCPTGDQAHRIGL